MSGREWMTHGGPRLVCLRLAAGWQVASQAAHGWVQRFVAWSTRHSQSVLGTRPTHPSDDVAPSFGFVVFEDLNHVTRLESERCNRGILRFVVGW